MRCENLGIKSVTLTLTVNCKGNVLLWVYGFIYNWCPPSIVNTNLCCNSIFRDFRALLWISFFEIVQMINNSGSVPIAGVMNMERLCKAAYFKADNAWLVWTVNNGLLVVKGKLLFYPVGYYHVIYSMSSWMLHFWCNFQVAIEQRYIYGFMGNGDRDVSLRVTCKCIKGKVCKF